MEQDTTKITDQFLAQLGEDRGARIDIQGSTFKHSKFCKGLISYRQQDSIEFDVEPKFLKFNNQFNRTYEVPDGRNQSFIRIKESQFVNLAHGQSLEALSNLDVLTTTCGSGITDFTECVFSQYDHRGFVINSKGFPGSI